MSIFSVFSFCPIFRTTVCWDPEILLPWQRDVTTSLCRHRLMLCVQDSGIAWGQSLQVGKKIKWQKCKPRRVVSPSKVASLDTNAVSSWFFEKRCDNVGALKLQVLYSFYFVISDILLRFAKKTTTTTSRTVLSWFSGKMATKVFSNHFLRSRENGIR